MIVLPTFRGCTSNRFNPARLRPVLWLDAADPSTLYDATTGGNLVAADGLVKRWNDKSGNAYHAVQAADAKRAQRKAAIQNGKDVVRFAGAQSIATPTITFSTQYVTVFSVYKKALATGEEMLLELSSNFYSYDAFMINLKPAQHWAARDAPNNIYSHQEEASITTNAWHAWENVQDRTLAVNEISVSRDGVANTANYYSPGNAVTNIGNYPLYIGSRADTSLFLSGDIGEIIIFNKLLTAGERTSMLAYLKTKWGTP